MTITSAMLSKRYAELDVELTKARSRAHSLVQEFEIAHTKATVLKAEYDGSFSREFNRAEGAMEARKHLAQAELESMAVEYANAKAKADILKEYLNVARDDIKAIMMVMTSGQSLAAFTREELKL
jgi:F0F1-type ATP synthase membrane subunit b/b'